jgi:hypothetical protein
MPNSQKGGRDAAAFFYGWGRVLWLGSEPLAGVGFTFQFEPANILILTAIHHVQTVL